MSIDVSFTKGFLDLTEILQTRIFPLKETSATSSEKQTVCLSHELAYVLRREEQQQQEISFTTILRDSCKIYSGLLLYQSISEKQNKDFEHDPEIANMLIEILNSLELMCENDKAEYKANFEDTTFIFSLTLIAKLACSLGDILLLKKSLLLLCPQSLIELNTEERNSILFSTTNESLKTNESKTETTNENTQKTAASNANELTSKQTSYKWDDVVCGKFKEKIIIHKLYFNDSSEFSKPYIEEFEKKIDFIAFLVKTLLEDIPSEVTTAFVLTLSTLFQFWRDGMRNNSVQHLLSILHFPPKSETIVESSGVLSAIFTQQSLRVDEEKSGGCFFESIAALLENHEHSFFYSNDFNELIRVIGNIILHGVHSAAALDVLCEAVTLCESKHPNSSEFETTTMCTTSDMLTDENMNVVRETLEMIAKEGTTVIRTAAIRMLEDSVRL